MSEVPLYTSSGEGAIFDPEEVLGRFKGPVVGRMSLLATSGIVEAMLLEEGLSYRATSLIRNRAPLGPYSRIMPRALWWSDGGGLFLMSEVPMTWLLVRDTRL